jgi:hypothetical protein
MQATNIKATRSAGYHVIPPHYHETFTLVLSPHFQSIRPINDIPFEVPQEQVQVQVQVQVQNATQVQEQEIDNLISIKGLFK